MYMIPTAFWFVFYIWINRHRIIEH